MVEFRVKNEDGNVIGYERLDENYCWYYALVLKATNVVYVSEKEYAGTISQTVYRENSLFYDPEKSKYKLAMKREQFSGLKTESGVKIYVGDKLNTMYPDGRKNLEGIVVFDNGYMALKITACKTTFHWIGKVTPLALLNNLTLVIENKEQ